MVRGTREESCAATIREYAALMRLGETFPPAMVFFDGANYWLGDGLLRLRAWQMNGAKEIPVEIRHGEHEDARRCFLEADARHGARYTRADREYQLAMVRDLRQEWKRHGELTPECDLNLQLFEESIARHLRAFSEAGIGGD